MSGPSAAPDDAADASPLTEQLRRGFRWLKFEPALEQAWQTEQFLEGLKLLRAALLALITIILAINQIDFAVLPVFSEVAPRTGRVGPVPVILLIGFLLTFTRRASVWYRRIMSVAVPGALMLVSWYVLKAWELGEDRLFSRLIIAIAMVYFVVGLPFRRAFLAVLGVWFFFLAAALAKGMPAASLWHYASMLFLAAVIGAVGAYALEHASRTAWLEGRLLAELALHDGLTGIANRRRFDEHLERVWQQGMRENRPVSMLFADIDHFKKYNDRYGHQAGDEILKSVAAVLARHARRPFDIAARFGGEEFAVLLYDAASRDATRIAEDILAEVRALELVHEEGNGSGRLTISIGVATAVPQSRRTAAGLLQLADQALYAAKDGGRDQAKALQDQYEHMQTGYFHRRMLAGGTAPEGQ